MPQHETGLTWQTPRERDLERQLRELRQRLRRAEADRATALALLRTVTAGTELEGVEAGLGADAATLAARQRV